MLWKEYIRVRNYKLKYIIHEKIMTREGTMNIFASISYFAIKDSLAVPSWPRFCATSHQSISPPTICG
jgi:hypothetical protein